VRPTGDKIQRAGPLATMALGGRVKVKRVPWTVDHLATLHGFPDLPHDDADGASKAYTELVRGEGESPRAMVVKRERVEGLLG